MFVYFEQKALKIERAIMSQKRAATPAAADTWSRLTTPPLRIRAPTPLEPLCKNRRILSMEEEHATVHRLVNESCEHKQRSLDQLNRRVYGETADEKPRLEREDYDNMISRLYQQGVKDQIEKKAQLRTKYLSKYAVPHKKYETPTEQSAAVDRLFNTAEKDREVISTLDTKYNPRRSYLKRRMEELIDASLRYNKGGFARAKPQ